MLRALYTAASGMSAQEMNLDNVANNLANSSTAGFRKRRVQFEDLLYQNIIMPGTAATQQTTVAAGLQVGLGTRSAASEIVQTQGDFSQTGNPLDLAIRGQGFFQVTLPSGETAYTRSGAFHMDAQGNIVTADGNPMEPGITIPANATSVTIGQDGTANSGIGGAVTELNSAYNHITEQRVFFGNAMNQLQSQQNYLNSEKVNLNTAATSISGADIADSATKVSQAELALNAELAAMSKVSQTSLFDYLK